MKELYIDPTRTELPETGIYVRAKNLVTISGQRIRYCSCSGTRP
jgi:hypothetical protein